MKKILAVLMTIVLFAGIVSFAGCGTQKIGALDTTKLVGNYAVESLRGTEINVYNWGEYISDGEDGAVNVIAEFENLTGMTVNYTT